MKTKLLLTLVGALLAATALQAGELKWLTDLSQAKEQAKKEHKVILADFTGSDWCGFCIKQHKEVFSTSTFADYAKDNLVLLKVDFPHRKKLPEAQQKANDELGKRFKIRGYPTLIALDANGKELKRWVGYGGDGPKPLIKNLKAVKSKLVASN